MQDDASAAEPVEQAADPHEAVGRTPPPAAGAEALTEEARALIASAGDTGVPAFMTESLKRIAADNGIAISPDSTPNQVIDELRRRE